VYAKCECVQVCGCVSVRKRVLVLPLQLVRGKMTACTCKTERKRSILHEQVRWNVQASGSGVCVYEQDEPGTSGVGVYEHTCELHKHGLRTHTLELK
jgi:carbonic anhydrase/acetyltransferase-like protein (isoleucine patch superfamily)